MEKGGTVGRLLDQLSVRISRPKGTECAGGEADRGYGYGVYRVPCTVRRCKDSVCRKRGAVLQLPSLQLRSFSPSSMFSHERAAIEACDW